VIFLICLIAMMDCCDVRGSNQGNLNLDFLDLPDCHDFSALIKAIL
jgi:hypothetical protein